MYWIQAVAAGGIHICVGLIIKSRSGGLSMKLLGGGLYQNNHSTSEMFEDPNVDG